MYVGPPSQIIGGLAPCPPPPPPPPPPLPTPMISSENVCLQNVVQRQQACSFNNEVSFFYLVALVLEKYGLPTLSQLIALNLEKLRWKIMSRKAVETFCSKVYVNDIKSKKTLRHLSVRDLRVGRTHKAPRL